MSDDSGHWFSAGGRESAVQLRLERYPAEPGHISRGRGEPVLLLHGASANHGTFLAGKPGLARWLAGQGFDAWLLDWRGSSLVLEPNQKSLGNLPKIYNFNRAASEDLPAAIAEMRQLGIKDPISVLGHCMGSAVVAEAVALGHIEAAGVDRVVLIALGLFYEAPIDSRLKSEERILERLSQAVGRDRVLSIDPTIAEGGSLLHDWPQELKNLYDAWPGALRSHAEEPDRVNALCNRLSFMYGMPYHHRNLAEAIHGKPDKPASGGATEGEPELLEQFGAIPLHMYLHAARNLRRGHATYFDEPTSSARHDELVSDLARRRFRTLEKVTLITGALNRLWHRDSVDRMHEWLCRGSSRNLPTFHKHIFPKYAHQDLLWGTDSERDVYPEIAAGLRRP